MDIFQEIKQSSKWAQEIQFPSTPEWVHEFETWFKFLKKEDQFERFLPRLKDKSSKRDEAFVEIGAAYFLQEICKYRIIDWEPKGKDGKVGEFKITLHKNRLHVFCEVKSPGWEGEIVTNSQPTAQELERLQKHKYIEADGRFIDSVSKIRNLVEKAYPKFTDTDHNLLIIVDDLFLPLCFNKNDVKTALFYKKLPPPNQGLYSEGCFTASEFNKLSAVATLNIMQESVINYRWHCYDNPNALKKLPGVFIVNKACRSPAYAWLHFTKRVCQKLESLTGLFKDMTSPLRSFLYSFTSS